MQSQRRPARGSDRHRAGSSERRLPRRCPSCRRRPGAVLGARRPRPAADSGGTSPSASGPTEVTRNRTDRAHLKQHRLMSVTASLISISSASQESHPSSSRIAPSHVSRAWPHVNKNCLMSVTLAYGENLDYIIRKSSRCRLSS